MMFLDFDSCSNIAGEGRIEFLKCRVGDCVHIRYRGRDLVGKLTRCYDLGCINCLLAKHNFGVARVQEGLCYMLSSSVGLKAVEEVVE